MKIFSADQLRQWDAFTIKNAPISSIDLMEEAANACSFYLEEELIFEQSIAVFCGPGNNGGDGLAIARMLIEHDFDVTVYLFTSEKGSKDFEKNLRRYKKLGAVIYLKEEEPFPELEDTLILDAIFGIGLNKPVRGIYKKVIEHMNGTGRSIVSIDIPSGMFADKSSKECTVVSAALTLTFQQKKLAFFMPENRKNFGEIVVLDIGLLPDFDAAEYAHYEVIHAFSIYFIYKDRQAFTNKGDYGNACIIAGSYGMMGAAVLSANGCLRSGVGKLTCYVCEKGYEIMQIKAPEALCKVYGDTFVTDVADLQDFDVIGIGPGMGKHESHAAMLEQIFAVGKPMVIDADALNVLSEHKELYEKIPEHSILTPHPKEFERLFGKADNDFHQRELAIQKAVEYNIYIILKGQNTLVATPAGVGYFNETGNPGMATGGTGDVLTGIITGLLAQKYSSQDACILGVYIHGLAGDLAAQRVSENALIASDVYHFLGKAFLKVKNTLTEGDFD